MAAALGNAENIPYSENRSIIFVPSVIDGSAPAVPAPIRISPAHSTQKNDGVLVEARKEDSERSSSEIRVNLACTASRMSGRLIDVTECIRKEIIQRGLPDEDFEAKWTYIISSLELVRITEEPDKLAVLPFFLGNQADLGFRTQMKGKVKTTDEAFDTLRQTFLTEEARRANDTLWEDTTFVKLAERHNCNSKREVLLYLFEDIERLRYCTSSAATSSE